MLKSKLFFNLYTKSLQHQFFSSAPKKKICIIGSGPAGFYTAQNLLKSEVVEVDIFEKLPAPYGLIRYGVAPDHPEIKNVITSFNKVAEYKYCNFYGNVNIGQDITIEELSKAYHGIVLAYGADSERQLNIPGEDSKNVLSSNEFVAWYNGHPNFVNLNLNLDCENAVVIGHGNVAIDVARILLLDIDVLMKTDIAEHALEALNKSRVKKVTMVGRRGPLQVSFTTKEFRELAKLSYCRSVMNLEDFVGIPDIIPSLKRPLKRLTELVWTTANQEQDKSLNKSWELKFYRNPKVTLPDSEGRVENVVFGINKLKELDLTKPPEIFDTGEEENLSAGIVIKSIGYKSSPIDPSVPFDPKRCIVPNKKGKVLNKNGLYCSGWIKTGPKGVILPTMHSSYETVDVILDDIDKGEMNADLPMDRNDVLDLLKKRGVKYVTFEYWKKINQIEEERGMAKGKPRIKICNVDEMLKIANLT
ncbi:NADPH:adrenodoxin oxidoreductase, mitochondrial isoform X2 [Parasteatoda tepidariorum]|uniref:NADPH:adrenodoxin oxidoreductase, mitochondrial isoform X1 n=1 Tax=Parasteatoda tepidariorum TaxID=114398 RepID=UPI001C71F6F0|nr:NADPH:adrenodoxin oxidoreductase, mitochondrial [Parasteatoda tepidariorum]